MKFRIIIAVAVIVFVLLGVLSYKSNQAEEASWQKFKAANHCQLKHHSTSETSWGMTSNGKTGWLVSPATDTYVCDGGFSETRAE